MLHPPQPPDCSHSTFISRSLSLAFANFMDSTPNVIPRVDRGQIQAEYRTTLGVIVCFQAPAVLVDD
ncbi:hypothetical protein GGI1_06487, partial [Acidithiobacillus sp. GGI-221]